MIEVFDVVITGAGPGGYVIDKLAGNVNLKTLLKSSGVGVIGQTEAQLINNKTPFVIAKFIMNYLGKGIILGAHIIASVASDVIGELVLITDFKATIFNINNSIYLNLIILKIIHKTTTAAIHEHFNR